MTFSAEFEKVAMNLKNWALSVENSKPTRRDGTRRQKRGVGSRYGLKSFSPYVVDGYIKAYQILFNSIIH